MSKLYYEDVNQALSYLEFGDFEQRDKAISSLVLANSSKQYYDTLWRVFLSDEHRNIRLHSLSACINVNPKKVFNILEYCVKEQDRIIETYKMNKEGFYYNNYSKDSKYKFLKECIYMIALDIARHKEKIIKAIKS